MRVDYHMHTCFSYDSETTLEAVMQRAIEARIDRLCVTDHDTLDGAKRLADMANGEFEVVIGCEFSTEDGTQVVGLGLTEMIHEPRLPHLLEAIRSKGGMVLLPHPFRRGSGIFRPEMQRSDAFIDSMLERTDLIECFNGRDSFDNNTASFAFARERDLRAVASSDAHTAQDVGTVFVEYAGTEVRDGSTERQVYFPTQTPRRERPIKRKILERYHRHEERLPGSVRQLYRTTRQRYHRGGRSGPVKPATLQYVLPASEVHGS